ncbi:MAG: hypothetical protein QOH97_5388 [Actinoplanes sp.]|jgi:hypothetical protein|nr:hypothetical protein [Actinoplanes sp.]
MTGIPHQWFRFGPWTFSIHAADELIAATPRDVESIDVATWAAAYGLTHIDNEDRRTVNLIGPTRSTFNRAFAMTTDLTKPVIVAQVAVGERPPAPLLIDGTHRLYRAWREDRPRLPAYLLTPEESRQIRDDVLLGPGGTLIVRPPT